METQTYNSKSDANKRAVGVLNFQREKIEGMLDAGEAKERALRPNLVQKMGIKGNDKIPKHRVNSTPINGKKAIKTKT